MGFGVYFGDAKGAALFGGGAVGAGAIYVESWAELGWEEVDDYGFCQVPWIQVWWSTRSAYRMGGRLAWVVFCVL